MSAAPGVDEGLTGRCLCGSVRLRLHGEIRPPVICHCVDCQRWHGMSAAYVALAADDLEVAGSLR